MAARARSRPASPDAPRPRPVRVGLALGSGAARGWAHIGVIRGLEEAGLAPEIVCGSSIGAVVGGAYAAGRLDAFEQWVRALDRRAVLRNLDLSFRGGLFKARRVFEFMSSELPDAPLAELPLPFAAVATDLETGREIWLREGQLLEVLRASVAVPGLVTPVRRDGHWLVDGGLVNPVPVSLCRAMGADVVIAVDLNTTLLGRRLGHARDQAGAPLAPVAESEDPEAQTLAPPSEGSLRAALQELAADLRDRLAGDETAEREEPPPSLYEVITNSLNIMQVRITRSRMAGDPPDLLVTPRLGDFALLDFDRASEAIDEGRRAVAQALASGRPA